MKNLSDSQLYKKCKLFGSNARIWMRKFAGLLPEVYKRQLYKRRGFSSIHEFAAKLAGMSHETTDKILRLGEKLKDKPLLKEQFENGEQGWSKLEKVAYIATPETDAQWSEKVRALNLHALEAYVKEVRKDENVENNREEITLESDLEAQTLEQFSIPLCQNTTFKLRLLKQQFEKEKHETLNWDQTFEMLLAKLDGKTEEQTKSKKVIQICPECEKKNTDIVEEHGIQNRNISAAIKSVIDERSGGRCEFPNCNLPGKMYHHTRRFALRKNHDPNFIRFLCTAHERLAHSGLIDREQEEPNNWKIRNTPELDSAKYKIDQLVGMYRSEFNYHPE